MKTLIPLFSLLFFSASMNVFAQDITTWKDPDTGKGYYACKDESGRMMLTDSLALCEQIVGKNLDPKGTDPQKALPKSPVKKRKSSSLPLWEAQRTRADQATID
jgi:hypothetical protein